MLDTFGNDMGRGKSMPAVANERPLIHVVDDDASMRTALEGLFELVRTPDPNLRHGGGFSQRKTLGEA